MLSLRKIWRLLKETFSEWHFNEVSLLASSLAYYAVFSITPLLIIVMMIVGAVFGEAAAKEQIVTQLKELVGFKGAHVIATAIVNLRTNATGGSLRLIFSLGFLIFGATSVFSQIQNALNKIWEVKSAPRQQVFNFFRKRLLSFAMVLVIAFLLLLSFVGNTILVALFYFIHNTVPGTEYLWQIIGFFVSFGVMTVIFGAIFTILPDTEVSWRETLVGAIITSLLFLFGQFLFGLFLRKTNFGSAYGVAGSFIIVITWIYYSAHILFLGAVFTKVFAKRHGSPIVPSEQAVSLSKDDLRQSHSTSQPHTNDTFSEERSNRRQRNKGSFFARIRRQLARIRRRFT